MSVTEPGMLAVGAKRITGLTLPHPEKVTVAISLLLIALFIFMPDRAVGVLASAKEALVKNLPFMLLAVGLAAAAKATGAENLIAGFTHGKEGRMIVLMAVFGALTPFCSCGVIPVIASLLAAGVPLAPVMAFWMSSPLLDPNQFIITAGELGLEFAIARACAAVGLGLLSGFATLLLIRTVGISNPLRFKVTIAGANRFDPAMAERPKWRFWEDDARSRIFLVHGVTTFWFLVRWLSLAFLIEGLMIAFIPPTLIASWLGASGTGEIPLAALIGSVVYLNAFAAIPLVSGLIKLGMSPAAALTFLIAGAATSIPASMAVWVLVTRKVFVLHLALAIVGSLLAGYVYAAFLLLK